MKQIISLALKYIRRQKLRTTLTFLCVTLSVFIMSTFGAYTGSLLQTAKNKEIREIGSWEAMISKWLAETEDQTKALAIVSDHAVVSDSFSYCLEYSDAFDYLYDEERNRQRFIEFSANGTTKRLHQVSSSAHIGNPKILGENHMIGTSGSSDSKNGYIFPRWIKKLGYSEGDTISFTLRTASARYDEDSELIKAARQKYFDEHGSRVFRDDPEYNELEYAERKKACPQSLSAYITKNFDVSESDIPMTDLEYGEPFEYTMTIGGFSGTDYYDGYESYFKIDRTDIIAPIFTDFLSSDPALGYEVNSDSYIRINDNIDFDEGMRMLYRDLGLNEGDYSLNQPELNDMLLLLEFKSAEIIGDFVVAILLYLLIVLMIWFISRFVIDNAFEISSKERSTQYAALRIMGASKSQIAALVMSEGIFYTITAVPIGMISAYLLCDISLSTIRSYGILDAEFHINPIVAVVSAFLCILAIFISAYTSAMWASRKLSPAEALNFGRPTKKSKKTKHRKSKLKLGSKRFLVRYTIKNIARSKSRYLISTVTMTIGVFIFTFCLMIGIFTATEVKKFLDSEYISDFRITLDDLTYIDEVQETFADNDLFNKVNIYGSNWISLVDREELTAKLAELSPYGIYPYIGANIKLIDRSKYDKNIAELIGMRYDEFTASNKALFFQSAYGNHYDGYDYNEETETYTLQKEPFYRKLDEDLIVKPYNEKIEIPVSGVLCAEMFDDDFIVALDSELAKEMHPMMYVELKVKDIASYDEARELFETFIDDYRPFGYENTYVAGTGLTEFVSSIVKLAGVLIAVIWAVGILSMVNSINTGVLNRSRELLMLRSVGMTKKQLRGTVILESAMFSALSSVLGTVLACALYFVIFAFIGFQEFSVLGLSVGIGMSIIANVLIAVLAAIPGIRSLERAENLVRIAGN